MSPESPVLKAASLKRIRRVVMADGNRLVGIVSQGDAQKAFFQRMILE